MRLIAVFVGIAVLIILTPLASAPSTKIEQEVIAALENQRAVNVIVFVAEPQEAPTAVSRTLATEARRLNSFRARAATRVAAQDAIVSAHGLKAQHKFGIISAFAAEITSSDLKKLESDSRVTGIKLSEKVRLFRNESTPITRAPELEPLGINGSNVTVAVIDTGIDTLHPELSPLVKNVTYFCIYNATATFLCSNVTDYGGHGTHVSGILAGRGGYGYGNGTARNATLLGVKVFFYDSGENDFFATDTDIIRGIEWAVNNSADVISMSLGGGLFSAYCDSNAIANASNAAVDAGVTVVVATGNSANKTHIASPACASKVIAVGATTDADAIASFTNRNNITDVMAPGQNVWSTYSCSARDAANCSLVWYAQLSGTSMATPHVSGVVAQIIQAWKAINGSNPTPAFVEATLKATGKNISDSGGSNLTFPRIDAYKAVDSLQTPRYYNRTNHSSVINLNDTVNVTLNLTDNIEVQAVIYAFTRPDGNTTNATPSKNGTNVSAIYNVTTANLSYQIGVWNLTIYANDSAGDINTTNLSWQVFGWAKINQSNLAPTVVDVTVPAANVTAACQTTDANTSASISGYNISFFRNNSLLGQNTTNSSGWAFINFTADTEGFFGIKCNITDAAAIYYNDSVQNNGTQNLNVSNLAPNITIQSPANKSYNTTSIDYNISTNENLSAALFSIDGAANMSMSNDSGTHWYNLSAQHSNLTEGRHNASFFATDLTSKNNSAIVYFAVDISAPNSTNSTTNSTQRNATTAFSVFWQDNLDLGYFIFSTNNSGNWANDSAQVFSGAANFSNVTKVLNDTIGAVVGWVVYANDTTGNRNITALQLLTTTCTENWTYSAFGVCICPGTQARTATDANGCGTTVNRSALTQTCVAIGCGGGGGGGGGGPSIPAGFSSTVEATPTAPARVSFEVANLAATEVEINVATPATNIQVNVKPLTTRPAEVGIDPGTAGTKVFQYMEVTSSVSSTTLTGAKIKFKVGRDWIAQNRVSERNVALNRYSGGWTKLPTTLLSSDATNFYYQAETPGFSVFAITAELEFAPQPPAPTAPAAPSANITKPPAPKPAAQNVTTPAVLPEKKPRPSPLQLPLQMPLLLGLSMIAIIITAAAIWEFKQRRAKLKAVYGAQPW